MSSRNSLSNTRKVPGQASFHARKAVSLVEKMEEGTYSSLVALEFNLVLDVPLGRPGLARRVFSAESLVSGSQGCAAAPWITPEVTLLS